METTENGSHENNYHQSQVTSSNAMQFQCNYCSAAVTFWSHLLIWRYLSKNVFKPTYIYKRPSLSKRRFSEKEGKNRLIPEFSGISISKLKPIWTTRVILKQKQSLILSLLNPNQACKSLPFQLWAQFKALQPDKLSPACTEDHETVCKIRLGEDHAALDFSLSDNVLLCTTSKEMLRERKRKNRKLVLFIPSTQNYPQPSNQYRNTSCCTCICPCGCHGEGTRTAK